MVGWACCGLRRLALGLVLVSFSISAVVSATLPPVGSVVTGPATASDGDSLRMGSLRIRLHGIDAPETGQSCHDGRGQPWDCGAWSAEVLQQMVRGQRLSCLAVDHDRYGRLVARCALRAAARAETDLGAAMVGAGAARAYRAYSAEYLPHEAAARAARRGIWQGVHQDPARWRAARREATGPASVQQPVRATAQADGGGDDAGCRIKGNISGNGQIYHLPSQRDYDRVVIRPEDGERWFCNEAEARAAGWRAARN
jgi:endonuclease YncB( thermonuclease family)